MVRKRIKSKKDLLEFSIGRYTFYSKIFKAEQHGDLISKFYLKDFLTDLLLIQEYADRKEDDETSNS